MARALPKLLKEIDDVHRYFVEVLGYEKYDALWKITEHITNGLLLLNRQRWVDGLLGSEPLGNPEVVDGSYFFANYMLGFNDHGRATVVPRRTEWCDYHWTIDGRCDVRALWPPLAAQTAPDQQPENKAGPDSEEPDENKLTRGQRQVNNALKHLEQEKGRAFYDLRKGDRRKLVEGQVKTTVSLSLLGQVEAMRPLKRQMRDGRREHLDKSKSRSDP
jgi:hypothetical protein